MRRISSHVVWLNLLSAADCMTVRRVKIRSASPDDPFVESVALDDPELGAGLAVFPKANLEELSKVLDSDQSIQKSHFGPQWARWATLTRSASSQVANGGSHRLKAMTNEEINERTIEQSRRVLDRNYQTYEEYLEKELATGSKSSKSESDETELGSGLIGNSAAYDRAGQKFLKSEPSEILGSEEAPVPSFMNDMMVDLTRGDLDNTPLASDNDASSSSSSLQSSDDFPHDDPSMWSTEDVIKWIEEYAEEGSVDETMKDAFRMVRVDGNMLLNKVTPPEMFKQMRRWHIKRQRLQSGSETPSEGKSSAETLRASVSVSQILVQETIYLCYPYCCS